jgi:3-deoxy-D-manno-octulosonic-acid transferase
LESLWPLIVLAGTPGTALTGNEIVVTILSESAWASLERLKETLQERRANVLFLGYSPWEGSWGDRLDQVQPTFFITVKYEAWPDLWVSLQERNIPLVIIGARARKSLRIAKKMTELLVGQLPRLYLFPCDSADVDALKELFPQAILQRVDEPRWERVLNRSKTGNIRAQELAQACSFLPRPWGIIGNAWLEDLKFLSQFLNRFQGSLWVVPHDLKTENISKIKNYMIGHQLKFITTQGLTSEVLAMRLKENVSLVDLATPKLTVGTAILVDEMGFLSELYSNADWAYVGGGFGAGIHSTIEPAIYGIPIAIGPIGSEKFSEVTQLKQSGQLNLLKTPLDLVQWERGLAIEDHQSKVRWKAEAESRCGGASQILYSLFQGNK